MPNFDTLFYPLGRGTYTLLYLSGTLVTKCNKNCGFCDTKIYIENE